MAEKDFLDELIEESTERNPEFPSMVDEAYERRRRARKRTAKSGPTDLSQNLESEGKVIGAETLPSRKEHRRD